MFPPMADLFSWMALCGLLLIALASGLMAPGELRVDAESRHVREWMDMLAPALDAARRCFNELALSTEQMGDVFRKFGAAMRRVKWPTDG